MGLQIVKLLDPIQLAIAGTFTPMGAYDNATNYAVGDQVDYNGSSYIMYVDAVAGTLPTDNTKWGLIASKGDTGATGGTGTLADLGGQPLDGTLTSLAAYNTNGILTQTAADTFTGRTITGTTNQVTVTNGDGVGGNPTLSLPQNIHTGASPTFAGATLAGHTAPSADSTYTLGTSSLYWSNTYTDRLYLNSTAYLDGSSAGRIGIKTSSPVETLDVSGNLNIKDADTPTKQYRLRTSGSALDFEGAGESLYFSVWSGAGYTGTQRYYFLAESGASYMQCINTWQWRDNPHGTTNITIDGTSKTLTFNDTANIVFGTTTGTKIGTAGGASGQKLAFWGSTPIVQPVLATGAGRTVDEVITVLQNLGLVRQS